MSLPASTATADEMFSDFCGSSSQFAAATGGGDPTIAGMAAPTSTSVPSSSSPTANVKTDNILSPDEESKKSIEDFLGKIDSNLAKTKKYVKNRYALTRFIVTKEFLFINFSFPFHWLFRIQPK